MVKNVKASEFMTGSDIVEKIDRVGSLASLGNWAKEMERSGYSFSHDGRGRRIYATEDMKALENINRLIGERSTLKQAVQSTLEIFSKDKDNVDVKNKVVGSKISKVTDESLKIFIENQNRDMNALKKLLTEMLDQNKKQQVKNVELEQKLDDVLQQNKKALEAPKKNSWFKNIFK